MIAESIKQSFAPTVPLTIHWDGKMMRAFASKSKVDCVAILVSGDGVMKILAVPTLASGTGRAQEDAVTKALTEWHIENRVQAMSFDTTSSNTGNMNGTCMLIEEKLKKKLLNLACRHHIHELIIDKVSSVLLPEVSTGPNNKLFQRFSQQWDTSQASLMA